MARNLALSCNCVKNVELTFIRFEKVQQNYVMVQRRRHRSYATLVEWGQNLQCVKAWRDVHSISWNLAFCARTSRDQLQIIRTRLCNKLKKRLSSRRDA